MCFEASLLNVSGRSDGHGSAAQSNARQPDTAPIHSHPYGQTYSEWATDWWQVALETPASVNPITDKSGEHCDQGNMGNVWFLFGSLQPGYDRASLRDPGRLRVCSSPWSVRSRWLLYDPPEERTEDFIRARVDCLEQAAATAGSSSSTARQRQVWISSSRSGAFYDVLARRQYFRRNREPDSRTPARARARMRLLPPLVALSHGNDGLHLEASTDECFVPGSRT